MASGRGYKIIRKPGHKKITQVRLMIMRKQKNNVFKTKKIQSKQEFFPLFSVLSLKTNDPDFWF